MGVSAVTGENIDEFFTSVQACGEEYLKFYKPELDRKIQVRHVCSIPYGTWYCCELYSWPDF